MYRRGNNAYAHYLDYQYDYLEMSFLLSKNHLCWWISPHCGKYFFPQCSTSLVDMRFCRYIPRDKNKMMHHPSLLEKVVFLASKTLLSPIGTWKKTFLSTLNFMILQMVRIECVKFGKHVDRQVKYKILWLKVLNNAQTLHNPPYFW
jgi:hypothetical protein